MTSTPDSDRPTSPATERSPLARQVGDAIRRHLAGDRSAMTDLTRIIRPWLHHVIRSHRLPAHTVEDAVQSTLLAVLRHVDDLRNPDAGLAWISVVARREAPDVVMPAAPDPAEIALDRISHAVVRRTICALPPRHRRLLELISQDDRPNYASISFAMKMPIGSIGPTRRRGLERMRQLLADDPAWEWDVPA
jgi:DNA-directed RNA polymerase specialized sigma24 family protein